jgi:hypothetical protein
MKKIINWTLFALFAAVFFSDGFLSEGNANTGLHLIPKKASYVTELLSMVTVLCLFINYALHKKLSIRLSYLLFFFFFVMHALSGIILNAVPSGAVFAGIRRYFAFMPFFFLPIVYKFSDDEIMTHLKIILFFGLIQFPFTIYQRFFLFREYFTGDYVTGTLGTSSILSICQICCITILTAFFIKKKVKMFTFLTLSLILFIPTALNETKGTMVLFRIAITITILCSKGAIINLKKISLILTTGLLILIIFVPLYGYLYSGRVDVITFFKGGGHKASSFEGYLYKGLSEDELEDKEPGRLDAFIFPFKKLAREPFKLIIGLGMGNVNNSGVSIFMGEYTEYDKYGANMISAASLIWETGLIGLLLHVVFLWLVLKDAIALRSDSGLTGCLALGWVAVPIILGLSFFYKNIFHVKAIAYLFWYISGLVAARRASFIGTASGNNASA